MRISNVDFRPIQESDDPQVKEIILKSLEEYGANREGFAAKDPELDSLSQFYKNIDGVYFVVEDNKRVLGGAGIAPLKGDSKVWELQKMYLDSDSRGRGLGKLLMTKCIDEARKRKILSLYIETLDSMKEANALYLKFGFVQIEKPLGNTGHFGCDRYYLLEMND